jgi:hypothetical protein
MQIMLLLVILAVLVVVTLFGIFIGSLLLGGMLSTSKVAKWLAPIFFIVVPMAAMGALAGGVLIGYLAVSADERLILIGPVGGLITGGASGLSVGTVIALLWWRRIARQNRDNKE